MKPSTAGFMAPPAPHRSVGSVLRAVGTQSCGQNDGEASGRRQIFPAPHKVGWMNKLMVKLMGKSMVEMVNDGKTDGKTDGFPAPKGNSGQ